MDAYEKRALKQGFKLIAGVDEAGRGPLAGPVVASAVIFPKPLSHPDIKDSKALTPSRRESSLIEVYRNALSIGIGISWMDDIDGMNIHRATLKAMEEAVRALRPTADFLIIDGPFPIATDMPQLPLVKGDALSVSVAAASIVAKVTRDKIMRAYHRIYPHYNFARNKGYGTPEHLTALKRYGPCPIHRRSFKGVTLFFHGGIMTIQRLALGKKGEEDAIAFLKGKGYKILERNFRCPLGEIDIIALDKGTLVFVEVKTRRTNTFGLPQEAVGERKQGQLSKVASYFINKKKINMPTRFDVVAVGYLPGGKRIDIIKDAFQANP
ncbi:MAG: ribonuclease HII [Deltaproteobacteria bacterium]|nr:ribonuclease HII [Deltaproteobacteria bacterium]